MNLHLRDVKRQRSSLRTAWAYLENIPNYSGRLQWLPPLGIFPFVPHLFLLLLPLKEGQVQSSAGLLVPVAPSRPGYRTSKDRWRASDFVSQPCSPQPTPPQCTPLHVLNPVTAWEKQRVEGEAELSRTLAQPLTTANLGKWINFQFLTS